MPRAYWPAEYLLSLCLEIISNVRQRKHMRRQRVPYLYGTNGTRAAKLLLVLLKCTGTKPGRCNINAQSRRIPFYFYESHNYCTIQFGFSTE